MQIAILIMFTFLAIVTSRFLQERLALIDKKANNFILRGCLPIHQGIFQANQLKQGISKFTKLKEYNLVIISLLNFLTAKQTRNRYIEEKYLEAHPQYGKYINHYILGSIINPNYIPVWLRNMIIPIYQMISLDRLNKLTELLHGYLQEPIPTVVYIHCSAGIDRTGLISGSYKLKYHDKSIKQIYKQNLQFAKNAQRNHLHFNTVYGLQWFCLNLGLNHQDCQLNDK